MRATSFFRRRNSSLATQLTAQKNTKTGSFELTVSTKHVSGRRNVRYDSLDDLLSEAQSLVSSKTHTLGNWSLGQILWHLGRSMDASVDGFPMRLPWPLRLCLRVTMKRRLLLRSLPAGLRIPRKAESQLMPLDVDPSLGLKTLRDAIARQQNTATRAAHPALGEITSKEWTQAHLRHAELHMSFVLRATEKTVAASHFGWRSSQLDKQRQ